MGLGIVDAIICGAIGTFTLAVGGIVCGAIMFTESYAFLHELNSANAVGGCVVVNFNLKVEGIAAWGYLTFNMLSARSRNCIA